MKALSDDAWDGFTKIALHVKAGNAAGASS
jgi:hypothetical protein